MTKTHTVAVSLLTIALARIVPCYAQSTPVMSLQIGNAFLSDWSGHYITDTILSDTLMADGRTFYYCTNHLFYYSDSSTLSFLGADSELVICDFRWGVGDTVISRGSRSVVRDKGVASIFNESQPYITLGYLETSETITKKFGQTEYDYYGLFSSSHKRLMGARLNGIVYGSSPTIVSREEPASLQSSQSIFPNPSSRGINLQISVTQSSDLKIEVFNILGQKVCRVFEGKATTGQHLFRWNGNNIDGRLLPSGIYFVRFLLGLKATEQRVLLIH